MLHLFVVLFHLVLPKSNYITAISITNVQNSYLKSSFCLDRFLNLGVEFRTENIWVGFGFS